MAKAGSETGKGEKQEYQYSMPFISASGHELSFHDTPDAQRCMLKHTSGSHIEFKTDGSVFIKAVKDMHIHGSCLSEQQSGSGGGGGSSAADASTVRFDADLCLEVGGTLRIKAKAIEVEANETANMIAGTDFVITGNNVTEKAFENISIEGTKSVYVDTKEYRERSVSHRVEEGTMEDGGQGGLNYMNVSGNFVINNSDPNGGITLNSAGYMNICCGHERVDLIGVKGAGLPGFKPSLRAIPPATFTTIVGTNPGLLDTCKIAPGSYSLTCDAGADFIYGKTKAGTPTIKTAGLNTMIMQGDEMRTIIKGKRITTIAKGDDIKTMAKGNYVETIAKGNYLTTIAKGNMTKTLGSGNYLKTINGIAQEAVSKQKSTTAGGFIKQTAALIFLN